jgi:hypothetical protein
MMNILSRREWKRWTYRQFHPKTAAPTADGRAEAPQESEYPAWFGLCLLIGSVVLLIIYSVVFW